MLNPGRQYRKRTKSVNQQTCLACGCPRQDSLFPGLCPRCARKPYPWGPAITAAHRALREANQHLT